MNQTADDHLGNFQLPGDGSLNMANEFWHPGNARLPIISFFVENGGQITPDSLQFSPYFKDKGQDNF